MEFIDQLIDYTINCTSLSKYGKVALGNRDVQIDIFFLISTQEHILHVLDEALLMSTNNIC